MSKQSKAKEEQQYESKARLPVCMNCVNFLFKSGFHNGDLYGVQYPKEFDLRCGIGGFAVNKMATCKEFKDVNL